jgi:methanogenic corrinoid protein MtbC1
MMATTNEMLDAIASAVKMGVDDDAVYRCEAALSEGISAREIVNNGLSRGMHRAGELYENNEYFLPELLLASEAMHAGIQVVAPSLRREVGDAERETVVLGVVEGDVHEIGKNLVAVMLEAEGYQVIDLGFDVPPQRFLDEVKESGAEVLALSTMMTTTLPNMRTTVELARQLNSRPHIIVGGAPLSSAVAEEMGADGYEDSAARVPGLIMSLLV